MLTVKSLLKEEKKRNVKCPIIDKRDELDLPKSIVYSMFLRSKEHLASRYQLANAYRKDKDIWNEKARQLLTSADIPIRTIWTNKDLDKMAAQYTGYSFHLYERVQHHKLRTLKHKTSQTGEVIYLHVYQGNYTPFIPSKHTIGKTICRLCGKQYAHSYTHKCSKKCGDCRFPLASCMEEKRIGFVHKCNECNIVFYSKQCYDNHLKSWKRNRTSCKLLKRCEKCNIRYAQRNGHDCKKTYYCRWCQHKRSPGPHNCCWYPPTDENLDMKRRIQKTFRFLFFDCETVQLEDPQDTTLYLPEHWVNMICYSRACEKCLTRDPEEPCVKCGPHKIGYIRHEKGESHNIVVEKFVYMLLNDRQLNGVHVISHNGGRFDNHFVLAEILKRGITPKIIKRNLQLMQILVERTQDLECNSFTLKDSLQFLPIRLADFPKAFGFKDVHKGTFPFLLNHPAFYDYISKTLVDKKFYGEPYMTPESLKDFKKWYHENYNTEFNMRKSLLSYCQQDVFILHKGVCKYVQTCIDNVGFNPLVFCLTYASFSFFLLTNLYMKKKQIAIIPENGMFSQEIQSQLAIRYIQWLEHSQNVKIKYRLNGREHVIQCGDKKYRVDGYIEESDTVIEVLGCFWHGCPHHTGNPDLIHPIYDKKMGEVLAETMERIQAIKEACTSLHVIWEHDIETERKKNKNMAHFFRTRTHTSRLIIREAFAGARTQNYWLYAEASLGRRLVHLDVCSMYPNVLYHTPIPTGQPTVITDNFLPITLPLPYQGFLKVDILPPRDIQFPVVWIKHANKLLFPVCRSCAFDQKQKKCTHEKEEDRMIHATLYFEELKVALENGYVVKRCYEIWHWDSENWTTDLFRPFLKLFIKMKLESSGWPSSDMSEEEKAKYINHVKEELDIELDSSKIQLNPPQRLLAKLAMNSCWGKYVERAKRQESIFFTMDEFPECLTDERLDLRDLVSINDDILMATYEPINEYVKPLFGTSVIIGCITTTMGRLQLWRALNRLGDRALYCDTDSVICFLEDGADNLDNVMGSSLGEWQNEVPHNCEITEFVSTGPKVYAYKLLNKETGEESVKLKVRGFTIDNTSRAILTFDALKKKAKQLAAGIKTRALVTSRPQITKSIGKVSTIQRRKLFRPVMNKLLYNSSYETRPFGFRDDSAPFSPVGERCASHLQHVATLRGGSVFSSFYSSSSSSSSEVTSSCSSPHSTPTSENNENILSEEEGESNQMEWKRYQRGNAMPSRRKRGATTDPCKKARRRRSSSNDDN